MKTHGAGSRAQLARQGGKSRLRIFVAALIAAGTLPAVSSAQNGTWNQATFQLAGYNWSDSTQWMSGIVANGANNTATFSTPNMITGDMIINVDTPRTIGSITFDNPTTSAGWYIGGPSTLTLSNSSGPILNTANASINSVITAPIAGTQGYTKAGPGTLFVNGDSSGLTGGITLPANSGILSATQYTSGNAPLGANTITLSGGTLQLGIAAPLGATAPTLNPSSFNQKIVVPVGSSDYSQITATMDNGPSTAPSGNTWFATGQWTTNPTVGLPMGTTITGANNAANHYQLQTTSVNNALMLGTATPTGTMTFFQPVTASTLSFLTSSGHGGTGTGAIMVTAVLHYSNGTTSSGLVFSSPDWFNNTPVAYDAQSRTNGGVNHDAVAANPNLYDESVSDPSGGTLPISSVSFTWAANGNTGGNTAIMAIGGTFVPATSGSQTAPGTIGAQNFAANNVLVTANSSIIVSALAGSTLGNLTIGGSTLSVSGGNALTVGAVTLTGNPTFTVGTGTTFTTGAFSDGGTLRTITFGGTGTMTVPAAASLVAGTGVVVNGGTLNLSSGTSFGPSAAVTVNVGANLALAATAGPTTFASLNGTGGTVTLNGNTLTLGSVTGAYSGAIGNGSAAGALVKAGAGTQTLTGGSSFTGGVTVTGGTLLAGAPGSLGTGAITLSGGILTLAASPPGGFGGLGTGWVTNGNAAFVSTGTLQLTANTGNQAGSAWFGSKVPVGPFTASFTYTIPSATATPADGITFGFQTAGLTALGAAGGALGYSTTVTPSAVVGVNIYPPNTTGGVGSGVNFLTNGGAPNAATAPASAPVNAGLVNMPDNFTVTYDGTTLTVNQSQPANGGATFTSTFTGNLPSLVGSTAYIGFTGGTGGSQAQQQISNFIFTPTAPINYIYGNNVIATTTSPTIKVVANAATSSFVMGTLTLQVAGTTLNIQADPTSTSGQTYGLAFGPLALNGATTINMPANGTGGTGTLSLGAITNGPGTGSLTITGGPNLVLTNGGSMLGRLSLNTSNLSTGGNLTIGSLSSSAGVTLSNSSTSLITLTVGGDNTSSTAVANIMDGSGPVALVKTGYGTLTLSGATTYSGGTTVNDGTLVVTGDPGSGPLTVGGATAALQYSTTTATTKSIPLNNGTFAAGAGAVVTLNGGTFNTGYLNGPGAFLTGTATGARFVNITTRPSVTVYSNNSTDQFLNVTNGGALNIGVADTINAAGNINITTPVTLSGVTNAGSGTINVGAGTSVNMIDFQSYGLVNILPATSGKTLMTNTGNSVLAFDSGSRTFVGVVGGVVSRAGLELNGENAVVSGGLFVNNGQVTDNSLAGVSTIIADYGALVKGAGQYDNSPQTRNGGRFQAGNSPGVATAGRFVFGPGGVTNYIFAIDNATGQAGPTPDANGQVSGWGLVKTSQLQRTAGATSGDFVWSADSSNKLTVTLDTLVNPTTAGTDVNGLMANFDPTKFYSWPAVEWVGNYSGPTNLAALDAATTFDTSEFANPITGSFSWGLNPATQTLSLDYTPSAVPEPGTLCLTGLAGLALGWSARRRSRRAAAASE